MKDLKDLNLLDRFLFAEAMEDPQNMGCIGNYSWKRCSFEAPTPDRKRSTDFTSVSFC